MSWRRVQVLTEGFKRRVASEQILQRQNVPFRADGALVSIEALQQLVRVADNPSMEGRVIDRDASLGHHLLKIAQA